MSNRVCVLSVTAGLAFALLVAQDAAGQWSPDPPVTPAYTGIPFTDLAGGAVVMNGYRLDSNRAKVWGPVQPKIDGYYSPSAACADGLGGIILVASTGVSGGYVAANRVSVSGARLWNAGQPNDVQLGNGVFPVVTPDGANGAFVAWLNSSATNGVTSDIYAQHVNAAGAITWGTYGVSACSADSNQFEPAILADGSGGAFVVWRDMRQSAAGDIYGQHLDAAGLPLWGANGKAICVAASTQQSPVVASDGAGGLYAAWWDARSGNFRIYVQRMDAAGNRMFAANGIAVTSGPSDQLIPSLVPDGSSGVFVSWEDHRAGGSNGSDIYMTRLASDGTFLWPALTPVCTESHSQTYPSMIADGAGGVILDWCDARPQTAVISATLYTQRFNSSGAALWPVDGVRVDVTPVGGRPRAMAPDGTGGAYYEGGSGLARVLPDGLPAWQASYTVAHAGVADVANDEGGFALVTFDPAAAEGLQVSPFPSTYVVFRKIPGTSSVREAVVLASGEQGNGLLSGVSPPVGAWQIVSSITAYGPGQYSMLVPTHADSSINGPALDSYCVMTQTANHAVNLYSDVVSGYSVDNLPPGVPSLLVGGRTGDTSVQLAWQPSAAADLWHYSVYRGSSAGFAADAAHRIAVPTAANYLDGAFVDGTYYKVTATDRHGNESPAAQLAPANITGVAPSLAPRVSYAAIVGANPFSRRAVIEYGLAQTGHVNLAIYDLAGRKAASLVEGERPAGVQRVAWEGAGASGSRLEPGVYLARFEAPGVSRTLRLVRVE